MSALLESIRAIGGVAHVPEVVTFRADTVLDRVTQRAERGAARVLIDARSAARATFTRCTLDAQANAAGEPLLAGLRVALVPQVVTVGFRTSPHVGIVAQRAEDLANHRALAMTRAAVCLATSVGGGAGTAMPAALVGLTRAARRGRGVVIAARAERETRAEAKHQSA